MAIPGAHRSAVFLDRDGVLNRALIRDGKPYPPSGLHELEIPPDVPAAIARLKQAGLLLIVVSNQPDVARGVMSRATVDAINLRLAELLAIDEFRVCWHDDIDGCACRKPLPGLLLDAARDHHIDLNTSYMVGDRWRDMEAGEAAGCKTIFIDFAYAETQPARCAFRVKSMAAAAAVILNHYSRR